MAIECVGNWENCLIQAPDGVIDDVLYWKIGCLKKSECYLEWKKIGKKLEDIKLLEEKKYI